MKAIDIPIGTTFEDLTVTENFRQGGASFVGLTCKCGKILSRRTSNVLIGRHKSCGCRKLRVRQANPCWGGTGEISGGFWASIRSSARIRKIAFEITPLEAWEQFEKQNGKCALTGLALTFETSNKKGDGTASLDRIDSTKTYSPDNIWWVHRNINTMKWDFSVDEFKRFCKLVSDFACNSCKKC